VGKAGFPEAAKSSRRHGVKSHFLAVDAAPAAPEVGMFPTGSTATTARCHWPPA